MWKMTFYTVVIQKPLHPSHLINCSTASGVHGASLYCESVRGDSWTFVFHGSAIFTKWQMGMSRFLTSLIARVCLRRVLSKLWMSGLCLNERLVKYNTPEMETPASKFRCNEWNKPTFASNGTWRIDEMEINAQVAAWVCAVRGGLWIKDASSLWALSQASVASWKEQRFFGFWGQVPGKFF